MIKAISYVGIDGLQFGETEAVALSYFGNPRLQRKNRGGEMELHYVDFILRFDSKSGLFRECTFIPDCSASLNGKLITWNTNFLQWLNDQDKELKKGAGSIVSFRLGVALYGFEFDYEDSERALHVFRKHDWDIFLSKMTPFEYKSPDSIEA